MELAPGVSAVVELTVGEGDTAAALGSGDVPVLATPRVLALAEQASVAALRGRLPAGATTVGTRMVLEHRAPSAVGARVRARAQLVEVEGRRLVFRVSVHDGDRLVADGTVERVRVDRATFLGSAGTGSPGS